MRVGQSHTIQSRFQHDCWSCRREPRGGVGQNLLRDRGEAVRPDWAFTIQSWARERYNYPSQGSPLYRSVSEAHIQNLSGTFVSYLDILTS